MRALSQPEFETIASEIAEGIFEVTAYSVTEYQIEMTVRSRSGRSKYPVYIEYYPDDGRLGYQDPYDGGGVKIIFAREFRERVMLPRRAGTDR